MADQQKDPIQTTPTALVFAKAVLDDWSLLVGQPNIAPKQAVAVLYAHYILETGGINCYNWNIGNVKHVTGDGFDFHCLHGVWEGETEQTAAQFIAQGRAVFDPNPSHQASCKPRVSVVFQPPDPATRFRAYKSLSDAMIGHMAMLSSKGRYACALPAVLTGDVMAFAAALKSKGYMTSGAIPYGHGMVGPFSHFMASKDYELAVSLLTPPEVSPTIQEVQDQPVVHPSLDFPPIIYNFDNED